MGFNQIGYRGASQLQPSVDLAQNANQQYIVRLRQGLPVSLMPGQVFILPAGQWQVVCGRYTLPQWYDTNRGMWRNFTVQPGQTTVMSSDGTNMRIANLTGCPIGALITNVGAGNATNGYNTIGVTISAGNSTWGTLVGGSVNCNCNITAAGNYGLPPLIFWSPGANQTLPYIPPQFNCTIQANGNLATVSVVDQGAGLTSTGTLTVVQQPGDTNPGGGTVIIAGNNLTNSGNLTALWQLTPGQNGNVGLKSLPTFTFNVGGGMAATVIMNWCVTDIVGIACVGANYGNAQPLLIVSANAVAGTASVTWGGAGNANSQVANSVQDYEMWPSRMAWINGNSNAAAQASNANIIINDAGFGHQAVPILCVIPCNANQATQNVGQGVFTAVVSGVSDTSYIQAL